MPTRFLTMATMALALALPATGHGQDQPQKEVRDVGTVTPLGSIPIEDLVTRRVIGSDGKELGEIEDIILDPQSGQPTRLVVASGGFLGVGEKRIAIDIQDLEVEGDRLRARNLTQAEVEEMEEFGEASDETSTNRPRDGEGGTR